MSILLVKCGYGVVAAGCIALFIGSFQAKYRSSTRWPLRIAFILLAPIGIAWAFSGLYLQGHPRLIPDEAWHVRFLHISFGGIALGLLLSIVTNPEFYRAELKRFKASNQSLEPTAGRRDDQI